MKTLKAKTTAILVATVLAAAMLAGCTSPPQAPGAGASSSGAAPGESKLSVVATIFPQYDFVREIAGDKVDLTMLLPPGSECHSFEPSSQDIIKVKECDLFIYVGGGGDEWAEELLASFEGEGPRAIALCDFVTPQLERTVEGMETAHTHEEDDHIHEDGHTHSEDENHADHDHEEDHGHAAEEPATHSHYDEHVWTSPVMAGQIASGISEVLAEMDGANAALYAANTGAYLAKLDELDAAFAEAVQTAARKTILFGDRFPFAYLADEYGLEYYAAFSGCSTQTNASAGTIAFLVDKVREENLPVVFTIELSSGEIAGAIAGETGAKVRQLHSCHNVTREELENGATYINLMEQNLQTLKEALN